MQVGDVELCVEEYGDPAAPPILLVAGAASSMDWWDVGWCERLAAGGRRVVRYDHRDTGGSTTGRPGHPSYDGRQLARDCEHLVEALGLGPVHLAGVSMGGAIGQVVALRRPELVASLTLMSTSAVGGVETGLPGPTERVAAAFSNPPADPDWTDAASYADWVVAGQLPFVGAIPLDEDRVRAVAATIHARSRDVTAANNHWIAVGREGDDDEPLDVRRITVPTLVVHGSEDPFFPPSHGAALAEAIPGAQLLVVPGMGHEVPPRSTWDLVVPALLRRSEPTPRR